MHVLPPLTLPITDVFQRNNHPFAITVSANGLPLACWWIISIVVTGVNSRDANHWSLCLETDPESLKDRAALWGKEHRSSIHFDLFPA